MSSEYPRSQVTNVSFPPIGKNSSQISSKPRGYIAPENLTRVPNDNKLLNRGMLDAGRGNREYIGGGAGGVMSPTANATMQIDGYEEKKMIEEQYSLVGDCVSNTDALHRLSLWLEGLAIHRPAGSAGVLSLAKVVRSVDEDLGQAFLTDVGPGNGGSVDHDVQTQYVSKVSILEGRLCEMENRNNGLLDMVKLLEGTVAEYKDQEFRLGKTTHERNELQSSRDLFVTKYEKAEQLHQKFKAMVDSLTEQQDALREDKAAVDKALVERHREHEVLQEAREHTQKQASEVLNGSLLTSQVEQVTMSQKEEVQKNEVLVERLELAKKEYNLLFLTVQRLSLEGGELRDKCALLEQTLQSRQEHLNEVLEPYTPRPNWRGQLVDHAHIDSLGHVMGISLHADAVSNELRTLNMEVDEGKFNESLLRSEEQAPATPLQLQHVPEKTVEERVLQYGQDSGHNNSSSAKHVNLLKEGKDGSRQYSTLECVERVFEYVDVLVTRNNSLESEVRNVQSRHEQYKRSRVDEIKKANEPSPLVPSSCVSNRRSLAVDLRGNGVHVTTLGAGREVPELLRLAVSVPIRRRTMQRKECEVLQTEFWADKRANDARRGLQESHPLLQLHAFLRAQHGLQALIVETGYNLLDALHKQQKSNGTIRTSFHVITGVLTEETMLHQDAMIASFGNMLRMLNVQRSRATGTVTMAQCSSMDSEALSSFISHLRTGTNATSVVQPNINASSSSSSMQDDSVATAEITSGDVPGAPRKSTASSRLPLWLIAYWVQAFFPCKSVERIVQIVQFIGGTFAAHPDTISDYERLLRNQREGGGICNVLRLQDADECLGYQSETQAAVLQLLWSMKTQENISDIELVYEGEILVDAVCSVVLLQAAWMRADPQNSLAVLSSELGRVAGPAKAARQAVSVKNVFYCIAQEGRHVRPRSWVQNIPDRIALWVNRLTDPLLVEYLVDEGLFHTDVRALFQNKDLKNKKGKKLGKNNKEPIQDPYAVEQVPEILVTDYCEPVNLSVLDRSQHYGVPPILLIYTEPRE